MVNTNIQGVVPLAGRGHILKKGGFGAGEYRQLVNAEIDDDGHIISRRNIVNCPGTNPVTPMDNTLGFIGNLGPWAIVQSAVGQFAFNVGQKKTMWSPTDLPQPAVGWHRILGFFRYNLTNYWITLQFDDTTDTYTVFLKWVKTNNPGDLNTFDPSTITYASLSSSTILTIPEVDVVNSTIGLDLKSFFIFKERLWLVLDDTVYFSKATDPTVFAIPDGGFFKFNERLLKDAVALNDTIYLVGDSSIHTITYSVDPNQDSLVRTLSDSFGGDTCCVHDSVVYTIKGDDLYSVSNNNVTLVLDLKLGIDLNVSGSTSYKIITFGNYIVLLVFNVAFRGGGTNQTTRHNVYPNVFGQPNVFFLNMSNGAIHGVDFKDQWDAIDGPGYITDMYYAPDEGISNSVNMYFMTTLPGATDKSFVYRMDYTKDTYIETGDPSNNYGDLVVESSGIPNYLVHDIRIEIDSYVPDGNEYLMKKFRTLMLMGKLPKKNFDISYAFDNGMYSNPLPVTNTNVGATSRYPNPFRLPINQRARSISLLLKTSDPYLPAALGGGADYISNILDHELSIEDIRVLWTYTGRAGDKKDLS